MKTRVRRFVRHFEVFRNRSCRVPDKFRRARCGYDFIRGARHILCELARQENGRFRNPEIRGPLLGFIYASNQPGIFFRCKRRVEGEAKVRIDSDDRSVISKTCLPASLAGHRTKYRNRGQHSRCVFLKPNLRQCAQRRDDRTRCGLRESFRPVKCVR